MVLLSEFATSRTALVASLPARVSVRQIPSGWIVYFPPKVFAELSGSGLLEAVARHVAVEAAGFTGSGTASATIFPISGGAANLTGSGTLSAVIAATNADVGADFEGEGFFEAGGWQFIDAGVLDFSGVGNLNPDGLVEVEFSPLDITGEGVLSTTITEIEFAPADFAGLGDPTGMAYGLTNFVSSGMNKTGTQSFTTSWALLAGWTADTTTYPGSVVTSNALQSNGATTGATISVSLPYSSSFSYGRQARIKLNGTVIATSAQFTATSGTITVSATDVTLADGDDITVEVIMNTFASGSISAGGYVRIAGPLQMFASDSFDRPDGALGSNWTTTGGGTLNIVNGHLNGVGTPSVPLSYAWWNQQAPSDTQIVRAVMRWDGYDPEHSACGLVVRANPYTNTGNPGTENGVQFSWTRGIMALYYEDYDQPNGYVPVTGTAQYVNTTKFPEGAVIELRAEGNTYTALVDGVVKLQGTVASSVIPYSNHYVGATIQDDSQVANGGGPPGRLDDWQAFTP